MNSTSIFHNILTSSALKPVELLLRLSVTSYLLHHLSTDDFGLIMAHISALAGLGAFSSLGLEKVLNVQMHRETNSQARRFLTRKALATRFFACICVATVALTMFRQFDHHTLIWPAVILYLSESLASITGAVLTTFFHLTFLSLMRVSLLALQILVIIFLYSRGYSWEFYLASFFIIPLGQFIAQIILLQKKLHFLKKEPTIYTPSFNNMKSSWAMELSDYLLGKQSDTVLIATYISSSAAGIFSTAQQLFQTFCNILLSGFNQSSLSLYAKYQNDNPEKARTIYKLNILMEQLLVTVPLIISMPLLVPFMRIFGGEKFLPAVGILQATILATLVTKIIGGGTNTTVILALGDFKFILKMRIFAGVSNVILNIALLKMYPSPFMVVLGTNLVGAIVSFIEYIKVKEAHYKNPFGSSVFLILIALIPYFISYLFDPSKLSFILIYPVLAIVFVFASLFIFKPFHKFDHQIQSRIMRFYDYFAK